MNESFTEQIKKEYYQRLSDCRASFLEKGQVKIDLHCHDYNSDTPDELWGRMLKLPETWLATKDLLATLERNGCNSVTITNHNNARSCWDILNQGGDVLSGAEFTCTFKEEESQFHVLAYGFSPSQEEKLNRKRTDLLKFLTYAVENDIPTVLPHPLYLYSSKKKLSMSLYEKLALLFQRFEVLNGQRDLWQNLLTWRWLDDLDEQKSEDWSKKYGFKPADFGSHPKRKFFTGGSDDHMGIYAGSCGTCVHLDGDISGKPKSQIVLEALRRGNISPFGEISSYEKLNLAFMNYLIQVVLNMKDPGLIRMLLHNGSALDKFSCFALCNGISELQRHKFTMRFLKIFHDGIKGKRPSFWIKHNASENFKPIVERLDQIAKSYNHNRQEYFTKLEEIIPFFYSKLNFILSNRIETAFNQAKNTASIPKNTQEFIERFEISSNLRTLLSGDHKKEGKNISRINITNIFDDLSFPFLTAMVLAASSFMSTRVMYGNRSFLNKFAKRINGERYPKRALWLTDTLRDKNGVAHSLSMTLDYVKKNNCPIDFLVCSDDIDPEDHLHVVKPVGRFSFSSYSDQIIFIPDLLEIQKLIVEEGYDRIICSTEFCMGLVSIFLKEALNIKSFFYMHTDWLKYIKDSVTSDVNLLDRSRRMLRAFYRHFDKTFVLNDDHLKMLTGNSFQISSKRVLKTGHWVSDIFVPKRRNRKQMFEEKIGDDDLVLIYVGRLSPEKGVLEIPLIFHRLRQKFPEIKLLFVGSGPEKERLEKEIPEAIFMGWVESELLPDIYSNSDLLILPSKFDTFGNVILEAMSCGLPAASYNLKGPKEIIKSDEYGILADDKKDLIAKIIDYLDSPLQREKLRQNVLKRSASFTADSIMDGVLSGLGLSRKVSLSERF